MESPPCHAPAFCSVIGQNREVSGTVLFRALRISQAAVPEVQLVGKKAWGERWGSAPPHCNCSLFSEKHFTPAISIKLWGQDYVGRILFKEA